MSTTEVSANKLEFDTEPTVFRPQRAPPPPPTQSEPYSPIDIITTSSEIEYGSQRFDDAAQDVSDTCPLLLFEFNELFDKFDYESIRNKILTREMTTCTFTTVLWRIFLHCLPRDSSHWNQTIDASRDHYDELADAHLLDLQKIRGHNGDAQDLNHPLSQEENSLWNQFYAHQGLRDNIEQDVRRTCQEIEFFRQKHVLDLLLRVLYIHSRQHEHTLPYRQGMHEILAVIVYLIHMESVQVNEYPESNELMKKLYDPEYLAHDSYAIYEKIMEHLQQYYDFKPNIIAPRKNSKTQALFQRSGIGPFHINETIARVNAIFERLKDYDKPLHQKLEDLSIEPTVYGLRWLRLLFGREIPFESIPTLWTVIFCYDESFGFVDYFFLALLKKIGQLLDKHGTPEYSICLQYLMQPNVFSDVESVIHKALSYERIARQQKSLDFHTQSLSDRTMLIDKQKPLTPNQNYSKNPLIDLMKANSLTLPKYLVSDSSKEKEMTISPERETRKQLDENISIQRSCANFMHQFIVRLRRSIRFLHNSNEEEVLLQLNGLEQIANVLEGKLPFDDNTLQALLNYHCKEKKSIENDLNDTV